MLSYAAPPATDFLSLFGVRGAMRPNLTGQPLATTNEPQPAHLLPSRRDINAGNFGQSTANHEPRTIQLGFRLIF